MAKRAELFDGTILEFEDGTPADVIDRVAAEETDKRRSAEARVDLPAGVEPSTAGPGRGGLGGRPDAVPGNGLAAARPARRDSMRAVAPFVAGDQGAGAGRGLTEPPLAEDYGGVDAYGTPIAPDAAQKQRIEDDPFKPTGYTLRQAGRDFKSGIETVKMIGEGAKSIGPAVSYRSLLQATEDMDSIDQTGHPLARKPGVMVDPGTPRSGNGLSEDVHPYAATYATADPEKRLALRAKVAENLQRDRGFLADSIKSIKGYAKASAELTGAMPDFTDIETARQAGVWLMRQGIANSPMMAASMVGAAFGLPGLAVTSLGTAIGDMSQGHAAFAGEVFDPKRFKNNPDRFDEATAQQQELQARHMAGAAQSTIALAPIYAAGDLIGPEATMAMRGLKAAGAKSIKDAIKKGLSPSLIAKEIGGEAIGEGPVQEGVNIASEILTGEHAADFTEADTKRIINNAAAGAAGAISTGHPINIATEAYDAAKENRALRKRAEDGDVEAAVELAYRLGQLRRKEASQKTYDDANSAGFKVDPPFNTDDATTRRAKTIGIFQNLAAQYGIPDDVVSRATKNAKDLPADKVGPFFASLVESLQKRSLAPPVDKHATDTLTAGPVDDPKVLEQQAKDAEKAAAAKPTTPEAPIESSAVLTKAGTEQPTDSVEKGPKPSPGEAAKAVSNIESILAPKTPEQIDEAAHQAATSPQNNLPQPTDAQKEAGNYQKGHVVIDGMDVSIENPKDSIRSSKADAAVPWKVKMPYHYGYIRGTEGSDVDHVDLGIGPKGENGRYWVINQNHEGGGHDEHKVFTGIHTPEEAVALYKQSFTGGFGEKLFGSISQEFTADQLKAKLPSMSKAKPVLKPVANRETQVAKRETQIAAVDSGPRIIGRAGNTPTAATPIELRANPDGTLTPFHGGHELLDFESGQPIVLPVGVTDAQAVEAIKAAKSFGRKVKFYDAKEEPAAPTEEKPNAQAVRSDEGQVRQGGQEGQPGVQRGPEQGGGDLQQQAQGQPGDVAAGKPAEAAPARPEPSPKKVTPLTDAEAFASDYAAFDGKVIEQKVPLSDTSEPGVLRIDAANAMRAIDKRMDALEKLKTCLAKAA